MTPSRRQGGAGQTRRAPWRRPGPWTWSARYFSGRAAGSICVL